MRPTQQEREKAPATHGISRRTVARGMAWTAPVVLTSITVPAFAASNVTCPALLEGTLATSNVNGVQYPVVTSVVFGSGDSLITGTITYDTTRVLKVRNSDGVVANADVSPGYGTKTTTKVLNPDGTTANYPPLPDVNNVNGTTVVVRGEDGKPTLTVAPIYQIGTQDRYPGWTGQLKETEFTGTYSPPGFENYKYLKLHHPGVIEESATYDATHPGDAIVLTITFSTAVTNLKLSMTDIDSRIDLWRDEVDVLPPGFTYEYEDATSPTLKGDGTASNPFETVNLEGDVFHEEDKGDVHLTWKGLVSQVTIVYRATDPLNMSGPGQHIGVGNFTIGC